MFVLVSGVRHPLLVAFAVLALSLVAAAGYQLLGNYPPPAISNDFDFVAIISDAF
jgi:hypothetical protein